MSDNKRRRVSTRRSCSRGRRKDWRTGWQDNLRNANSTDRDNCIMMSNAGRGEYGGVWKKGDEVIEVLWTRREGNDGNEGEDEYDEYEKREVELMVVNIVNHSMRVLRGSGKELNEMDLSELKKNAIIDFQVEGKRWEGGLLKDKLFGYGCMYDENGLEYEGWLIDGKKRCYGIEYWSDIGLMKYCGCYYNEMKNGYGVLYDRNEMIEYEGLFKDDHPITGVAGVATAENRRVEWKDDCELLIDSRAESLTIADDFKKPNLSLMIMNCPLMSLKQIKIGNNCMTKAIRFVIDGFTELETLKIGKKCFELDDDIIEQSKCVIKDCYQLSEIHIGESSFFWYEYIELKDLPSLISVRFDDHVFEYFHSIVFESMND